MRIGFIRAMMITLGLASLSGAVHAHGLVQDPPARNWYCGAVTKPDHVQNGVAQYPVCGNAFFAPGVGSQDGYNFMSVLTHTGGRRDVGPRTNVCGFDSEAFNNPNKLTVWDVPIDWPTTPMTGGPRDFLWSISWGPHFSDTSDFRHWITKSSFVWQTGRPLAFADFEDTPFCDLPYDERIGLRTNITANPAAATFLTRCNVPARTGRHVIYVEWGRREGTFERFHGCIDAQFSGTTTPGVNAAITLTPNVTTFNGSGAITLNGTGSTGTNLAYNWTVSAPNATLYTITNPMSATATLNLNPPAAAQDVTVLLQVSNATSSDTETRTFLHQPVASTTWQDLGALTPVARTLVAGDRVSVRTVSDTGVDAFWPTTPITITAQTAAATAWPLALGNAVNALNGNVRIGVLANNVVTVQGNAALNRVYSMTAANIASAFLQHVPVNVLPAPTNLAGTAGNAQVALTWNAVPGATGYNVKRSLTTGGPYANQSANQPGTGFTNTGLINGTTYYYVVTALSAAGESLLSNQVALTPSAGPVGGGGGLTVTRLVTNNSPWFNELQVRLASASAMTGVTVTVTVQRTTGVNFSGMYNTVGNGIAQTNASTTGTVTYTWTAAGTLAPAGGRIFAAQFGGSGSVHPLTGDTWRVDYTVGGAPFSQTGTFP